jgi:WD40 repeat protein
MAIVAGSDLGGEAWLATASADRSIIIWDLTTMCPLAKTSWCHSLGICALAWLPEQQWLASGSADTTVNLWQLPADGARTLRRVQTLRGHTDTVHALAVIPSRGWLASGSADTTIRLWRTNVRTDQVRWTQSMLA